MIIDLFHYYRYLVKFFERIIFDNIYRFLDEHNLLNPNQSGFRTKDSCIYQLIEITNNIFSTFDGNPTYETRAVLLHISKAFDEVWHKSLLCKLESMGILGYQWASFKSNGELFAWNISKSSS